MAVYPFVSVYSSLHNVGHPVQKISACQGKTQLLIGIDCGRAISCCVVFASPGSFHYVLLVYLSEFERDCSGGNGADDVSSENAKALGLKALLRD